MSRERPNIIVILSDQQRNEIWRTSYLLVRLVDGVSSDLLEEFVGEEVEVFGRRHDIRREQDPHTIMVLGTEFIPKRIRKTQ